MATSYSTSLTRRSALSGPFGLLGLLTGCSSGLSGWSQTDLIEPKVLAQRLSGNNDVKPALFHVGFPFLYRSKHIPGSLYAGPGNYPDGLEALKKAVSSFPKTQEIVIYCGCCPWANCPNMKPAFALLKQLGFTQAKALMIETNMSKDWIQMGYPIENGTAAS